MRHLYLTSRAWGAECVGCGSRAGCRSAWCSYGDVKKAPRQHGSCQFSADSREMATHGDQIRARAPLHARGCSTLLACRSSPRKESACRSSLQRTRAATHAPVEAVWLHGWMNTGKPIAATQPAVDMYPRLHSSLHTPCFVPPLRPP